MMSLTFQWVLLVGGLFFGIILMMQAGLNIGTRYLAKYPKLGDAGLGVLEGALFGLMGLVLAFSFSAAALRFDARRQLIVEEANDIGTAYLRLDLLPAHAQSKLRENFRQYVDARLSAYNAVPDMTKVEAELGRSIALQRQIWTTAVVASQQANSPQAPTLVLSALNAMFDIANTRYLAGKMHLPMAIYFLMGVLILICSLLAGFEMGFGKARSRIHTIAFAALLAVTVYTIIDLEYPRIGLIQVKNFDQALVDVRKSMDENTATEVSHAK
jgi:hypothetical protein